VRRRTSYVFLVASTLGLVSCVRNESRPDRGDLAVRRDVEREVQRYGVTLTGLSCRAVPKIRDEFRCVAAASADDVATLVAGQRFKPSEANGMRSYVHAELYEGGCGSFARDIEVGGISAHAYLPGVSPRTSWNEIWYAPAVGTMCLEISYMKEN